MSVGACMFLQEPVLKLVFRKKIFPEGHVVHHMIPLMEFSISHGVVFLHQQ